MKNLRKRLCAAFFFLGGLPTAAIALLGAWLATRARRLAPPLA